MRYAAYTTLNHSALSTSHHYTTPTLSKPSPSFSCSPSSCPAPPRRPPLPPPLLPPCPSPSALVLGFSAVTGVQTCTIIPSLLFWFYFFASIRCCRMQHLGVRSSIYTLCQVALITSRFYVLQCSCMEVSAARYILDQHVV